MVTVHEKRDSAGGKITESRFRRVWLRREIVGRKLIAENGKIICILYPGRPNDEQGADFRDAVIQIGGRLMTGDVEFHIKSGD